MGFGMGYEILIENLCIEAIIGVLPSERETPQRVLINASIHYGSRSDERQNDRKDKSESAKKDLREISHSGLEGFVDLAGQECLSEYLDYVEIIKHIATMLKQRKYGLLESALDEIISSLKTSYPTITKIDLSLKKPDISIKDIFAKKDYAKNGSNASIKCSHKDSISDFAKNAHSDSIKDICKDSIHKNSCHKDFECILGVRKIREFL